MVMAVLMVMALLMTVLMTLSQYFAEVVQLVVEDPLKLLVTVGQAS